MFMRIRSFAPVLVVLGLVLSAVPAHAKSAIQLTPDGSEILVNKQIGQGSSAQQWVISLNVDFDTLTGNVFELNGSAPTFFSCDVTWDGDGVVDTIGDLKNQTATLDCMIASGCSALPCDASTEWHALGAVPPVPGSFFLP